MSKISLILLSCSVWLTTFLASGLTNEVLAEADKYLTYLEITKPTLNLADQTAPTSEQQELINNDDFIGDLAITRFGCDCAGHRNAVSQMLNSRLIIPATQIVS